MDIPVDVDGDGVSTFGDRYVFNRWLELGGRLGQALLEAVPRSEVLDVSDFFSSERARLAIWDGGLSQAGGAQAQMGPQMLPTAPFSCADANGDDQVTIVDVNFLLNYLFLGGPAPAHVETGVLVSGQSQCYNNSAGLQQCPGEPDPFAGQDGFYQMSWPRRFTVEDVAGDLTVKDHATGLEWLKSPLDLNNDGTADQLTLLQAFDEVGELNFGGHNDWILPGIRQLFTLVKFDDSFPPIYPDFELEVANDQFFWSSTSLPGGSLEAYVNFNQGHINYLSSSNMLWVRPVRVFSQKPHNGPDARFPLTLGDANNNDILNITDAVFISNWLFIGGSPPPCIAPAPENSLYDLVSSCSVPGGRYVDNGDGTVSDKFTGLMWIKTPATTQVSWQGALQAANNLAFPIPPGSPHTDWRLPSVRELQAMFLWVTTAGFPSQRVCPVFQGAFPGGASTRFWVSTTSAMVPPAAWKADFAGNISLIHNVVIGNDKVSDRGRVWAVRTDN